MSPEYQDDDWNYIIYEFAMNYNLETFRRFYGDMKKKEKEKVDAEKMRKLGYSEEQIARTRF